ncbi:MAG TPA: uroporphyrinogen-III C-methyltransferase [Gammaproteobacteria bacterium]|nr:uroporphyrinogen-III C-methyltransferase [Gammaproteobacteria bacterium]
MNHKGKVYLVGAGPGDPDLMSVKAMRLLKTADTLVYDRLVSDRILQCVPAGVSRVYAGKASGHHTLKQQQINTLLARLARGGQTVVRLKGGDPFIFGRGGEEALALAAAGIPFEIVPGISAAQACSAYAGIPLTHRGLAHGVHFITGHRQHESTTSLHTPHPDETLLTDPGLADPGQTLVIYMGLGGIARITRQLIKAGRDPQTPAAVVERGSRPDQRILLTTLEELPATVHKHGVCAPALLIVGEVVRLAGQLAWFKTPVSDPPAARTARRYA